MHTAPTSCMGWTRDEGSQMWGRNTLHLPLLYSNTLAVCAEPASRMQGTFPRFKGSPALFSSLCTSPRPEPQINISKHVSCLHPLSPSSSLCASLLCPYDSPPPNIISSTHSPFPVHHLFSSLLSPPQHPPTSLPACLPKCVIFFHISCFAAPVLPSIQSPLQYVLWINKKWSWKVQSGSWGAKSRRMKWWNGEGEGQGAVCSRILMST